MRAQRRCRTAAATATEHARAAVMVADAMLGGSASRADIAAVLRARRAEHPAETPQPRQLSRPTRPLRQPVSARTRLPSRPPVVIAPAPEDKPAPPAPASDEPAEDGFPASAPTAAEVRRLASGVTDHADMIRAQLIDLDPSLDYDKLWDDTPDGSILPMRHIAKYSRSVAQFFDARPDLRDALLDEVSKAGHALRDRVTSHPDVIAARAKLSPDDRTERIRGDAAITMGLMHKADALSVRVLSKVRAAIHDLPATATDDLPRPGEDGSVPPDLVYRQVRHLREQAEVANMPRQMLDDLDTLSEDARNLNEYMARLDDVGELYGPKLRDDVDSHPRQWEALAATAKAVRSTFGADDPAPMTLTSGSKRAREAINKAAAVLPNAWTRAPERAGGVALTLSTTTRAGLRSTNRKGDEMRLTIDERPMCATHELCHLAEENDPRIYLIEAALRSKLARGARPIRKNKEVFAPGFPGVYEGRIYDDASAEILSVGMEALTHGGESGLHPEHRDTTWGLLAMGFASERKGT